MPSGPDRSPLQPRGTWSSRGTTGTGFAEIVYGQAMWKAMSSSAGRNKLYAWAVTCTMGEARSWTEIWTSSLIFVTPPCGVLVNAYCPAYADVCGLDARSGHFLFLNEGRTGGYLPPLLKRPYYTLNWPFLWRAGERYCYLTNAVCCKLKGRTRFYLCQFSGFMNTDMNGICAV